MKPTPGRLAREGQLLGTAYRPEDGSLYGSLYRLGVRNPTHWFVYNGIEQGPEVWRLQPNTLESLARQGYRIMTNDPHV